MKRPVMFLLPALAAAGCLVRAGEEEFEVNFQTGRRELKPDPLSLPQWREKDRAAFAAGRPVNLGGGLWSEERYPLEPDGRWLAQQDPAETDDPDFVLPVDLHALAQGPAPLAHTASPQAAEALRTSPRSNLLWRSILAALAILLAVAAASLVWLTRRHHRRPRVFEFAEPGPAARLSGPHSGGAGAVLRW